LLTQFRPWLRPEFALDLVDEVEMEVEQPTEEVAFAGSKPPVSTVEAASPTGLCRLDCQVACAAGRLREP
jgi:hypothetical protein